MAGVTVHLHHDDGPPTADVLTLPEGESFIVLTISGSLSLIPPGRDAEGVASTRAIAAVLTAAADTLETRLAAKAAQPAVSA